MYTQELEGKENLIDLFTQQGPAWIFTKSHPHMMGVLPLGGDTLCLWDTGQPSTRSDYYINPSDLLRQISWYQNIGMVEVIKFNPD